MPELRLERVAFRVYRGAAMTAVGVAERASFRRDDGDIAGERVDAWFPAAGPDRPASHVTAVRATGNVRQHRFEGSGGVRAEQEGQVAVTEEARYSGDDGLIRGDRPIEVRGGRYLVKGPSFTLDPKEQVLEVEGGASARAGGAQR